jgi:hypothetical protein
VSFQDILFKESLLASYIGQSCQITLFYDFCQCLQPIPGPDPKPGVRIQRKDTDPIGDPDSYHYKLHSINIPRLRPQLFVICSGVADKLYVCILSSC